MQIKSEEVNYLIYRYLLEAGFSHSAFSFSHESLLVHCNIKPENVPSGALVNLIHKGLQYVDVELHTDEDGTLKTCLNPISLIEKHTCELSTAPPLPMEATIFEEKPFASSAQPAKTSGTKQSNAAADKKTSAQTSDKNDNKSSHHDWSTTEHKGKTFSSAALMPEVASEKQTAAASQQNTGAEKNGGSAAVKIPEDRVTSLVGHTAEVFTCAWCPSAGQLATGAGDSTARIWDLSSVVSAQKASTIETSLCLGLGYGREQTGDGQKPMPETETASGKRAENFIVTTLDWDASGAFLAAGSSEGVAYVWNSTGVLQHTMRRHQASIFSIRWNQSSRQILTGSEDSKVIVWNAADGSIFQEYSSHDGSVLDVDWRDDSCFASCSQDKTIKLFSTAASADPVAVYRGHEQEINAVKWDPSKTLLASCSDDKTAKIWGRGEANPLQSLAGHAEGIYTVEWNPASARSTLGSASFDSTAKLWDVERGSCLATLAKHTKPVYSISFSPDGKLLATGSVDRSVYVWGVDDGRLVASYACRGGVYDISWNADGSHLAVCTTKNNVLVLDCRMLAADAAVAAMQL